MSDQNDRGGLTEAQVLRREAEATFRKRSDAVVSRLGPDDAAGLLHELRVHQIELELQNEELRRTQLELDASRARYFQLYDLAPVGYLTLDQAGLIQQANLTGATMLAVARGALLGQQFARFLRSVEADAFHLLRTQLLATGESQSRELRMLRRDGTGFWALLVASVREEVGERMLYVALSDISARKAAEEAQRLSEERLQETRGRLEAQLQQAQKMESVGRLAGGVAHDFNNMLTVILGCAGSALDQTDAAEGIHADLIEIRDAGRRSAALTQQLLAFARKQPISTRVLDLDECIRALLKMLGRLLGENVRLTSEGTAGLWPIKMDPSQFDQLLFNLCLNARDAITDVGALTLATRNVVIDTAYCDTHPGAVSGDFVQLRVSDTGSGMDVVTLAHLFEPFFTTKPVGKGVGLGLATVYGVVAQNHGFIEVASTLGQGTTFLIHLPRHGDALEPSREPVREVAAPKTRGTVLVVEDDRGVRTMVVRLLESHGFTTLDASTPEEALRVAEAHRDQLQLLVTDVLMPGMNGKDLALALTQLQPGLKQLFMSGYTADIVEQPGSAVHFIQKPFSGAELIAKVASVLDSPRGI
jgi:PAS domain S-box-containing protein